MSDAERGPGRPPGPTEETYGAVLKAALELFLEGGPEAITFQRISEVTGVARTTIYRHWPDRSCLIATMLEKATFPHHEERLTGELRPDLEMALEILVWRFNNRPVREFLSALLAYGRLSENVSATGEAFIDGLLLPIRDVVERAVSDGELAGDPKELTADLAGPLMLRHVLLGEKVSEQDAARAVERFLAQAVA